MSRGKRFKLFFFLSIILFVLLGIFAASEAFRGADSIPDDRMARVKRGDLALSVVATGSIIPVTTVELKSKASGLVKQVFVEEGDPVEVGQVLMELDRELLRAQLREAEANTMAARARWQESEAEATSTETMKKKLQLDVRNLEDDLRFRKKRLDRYRSMSDDRIISQSELDQVERDYHQVSLNLEALRSELLMEDARIEAATKVVARVRAEVTQAEANLDRARENLRYATVTSPIKGTALKRHVEVGDAVSSILQLGSQATLLMTLGDMSRVFVEGRVDESDIGKVFVGQKARVKVDAFRDRVLPGEVIRIAPLGEEKDNVIGFDVRVSIQDPERILRARMSANAEIIIQEKKDILILPESSIIYDKERKTFAELYDPSQEGLKRRVPLEIGISNGTSTEVIAGLKEGDRLVLPEKGII
ncbi:MAG: efflux RND transporter periplasmic adaptor subunit [Acidobacteriota bacterium]